MWFSCEVSIPSNSPAIPVAISWLLITEWASKPETKFLHLHFRIRFGSFISSWQAWNWKYLEIWKFYSRETHFTESIRSPHFLSVVGDEESYGVCYNLHSSRIDHYLGLFSWNNNFYILESTSHSLTWLINQIQCNYNCFNYKSLHEGTGDLALNQPSWMDIMDIKID